MNMTKTKRRIYIAGPMRGLPQYNYPAFNAAEEWLELQGLEVVNPVDTSNNHGTPDQIEADPDLLFDVMESEKREIECCDAIYLLKGWEKSVGARCELKVALDNGLEIVVQGGGDAK